MNLKEILSYPFENPLRPMLFMMLALPVFLLGSFSEIGLLVVIGTGLFFFSCILLIASFFFLLFKKQWRAAIYTLLFIFTTIITIGLLS